MKTAEIIPMALFMERRYRELMFVPYDEMSPIAYRMCRLYEQVNFGENYAEGCV